MIVGLMATILLILKPNKWPQTPPFPFGSLKVIAATKKQIATSTNP